MTKSKRKCHLTTPESRKDVIIPGRNRYFWRFARGRCLGYRRGVRGCYWYARVRLIGGYYKQTRLGGADDEAVPDGKKVLSEVVPLCWTVWQPS